LNIKTSLGFPFYRSLSGLRLSGFGRACNEISGTFNVCEILHDKYGKVERLVTDLEQHCANLVKIGLDGSITYDSTLPNFPNIESSLALTEPIAKLLVQSRLVW
jgi:hypothetical protein